MRPVVTLMLFGLVAACSGIEPDTPQMTGANEMQPRPGLFSGPDGEFVLVGEPSLPPDEQLEEEVGAGT